MLSALRVFLFIDFNDHIRADPPTHRTTRAFFRPIKDDKVGPSLIERIREGDQLLRASENAKLTTLTPLFVDDDLTHNKTRKS